MAQVFAFFLRFEQSSPLSAQILAFFLRLWDDVPFNSRARMASLGRAEDDEGHAGQEDGEGEGFGAEWRKKMPFEAMYPYADAPNCTVILCFI